MAENKRKEEFACVVLSRADFECMGYDTNNISDEEMAHIARKIGDSIVSDSYWELIKIFAEESEMPNI